ncbi:thioredoxine 2 [Catenaria anguillulae PL171]|uniref:Thioredoxin n=1 Tax=Catenaria anguillulae PL171 TaxID=765915 RepID=A0A1Y2I640_9FUNG|nr:thioredoxine 2 [Catenaria anguillulae PL171]
MPVIQVQSTEEFKKHIAGSKLVVVDFYATWCGPCKVIAPKFATFSDQFDGVFLKVDVDELGEVAQTAGISAMPTFHLYKNGNKVAELVGADAKKLEQLIADNI